MDQSSRTHRSLALLTAALLPLSLAGGCFCTSFFGDGQSYATWAELESAVGNAATPIDAAQTGVSINLPILFASSDTASMRPGPLPDGTQISDLLIYPALSSDEKPVVIKLPGLRFGYETPVHREDGKYPVYCYLGVLPPGAAAMKNAKEQILATVKTVDAEAKWENGKTLAGGATADVLEVGGEQRYYQGAEGDGTPWPSKLVIYLVKKEHATVLVAYRGQIDAAKQVSLFKAGEASIATITSVKPEKPIDAPAVDPTSTPTGDYVSIPLAPLELIPPPGFEVSNQIGGLLKTGSTTQITAAPSPNPYTAMIGTYNDTFFRNGNITQASREEVTIGGQPATLMLLNRPDKTEWVLVFGDDSGSYVVTGTLADVNVDKDEVRKAMLSVRKQ